MDTQEIKKLKQEIILNTNNLNLESNFPKDIKTIKDDLSKLQELLINKKLKL